MEHSYPQLDQLPGDPHEARSHLEAELLNFLQQILEKLTDKISSTASERVQFLVDFFIGLSFSKWFTAKTHKTAPQEVWNRYHHRMGSILLEIAHQEGYSSLKDFFNALSGEFLRIKKQRIQQTHDSVRNVLRSAA